MIMTEKDKAIQDLRRMLELCRDEMCLTCGKYEKKHKIEKGSRCDKCKWNDNGEWASL